jgi:hypothetical protein
MAKQKKPAKAKPEIKVKDLAAKKNPKGGVKAISWPGGVGDAS